MYRIVSVALFFCFLTLSAYSQDSLKYTSKWQTQPSFGFSFPITNLHKGDVTDYLIGYDDHTFYWQLLSVSYFFDKHWGVDFNLQGSSSSDIPKRDDRFMQAMKNRYQASYFVTPSTGASFDNFNIIGGNISRGFLGVVYRLEKNKILFQPKFSLGLTSFDTDWGKAYLKEVDSNNVIEIYYSAKKTVRDLITISPSATFGYRITDNLALNLDLRSSYFKSNIKYDKVTTDLNTNQRRMEAVKYYNHILNVSVGTGLTIIIK